MTQPTIVEQVHAAALAGGFSAYAAQWLTVKMGADLPAVQKIIAHAARLPDHIRTRLVRNYAKAELLQAFADAEQIEAFIRIAGRESLPEEMRTVHFFMRRDASGKERLMSPKDVGIALTNALADADQHIDTTRPVSAEGKMSAQTLNEQAARLYGRKGGK